MGTQLHTTLHPQQVFAVQDQDQVQDPSLHGVAAQGQQTLLYDANTGQLLQPSAAVGGEQAQPQYEQILYVDGEGRVIRQELKPRTDLGVAATAQVLSLHPTPQPSTSSQTAVGGVPVVHHNSVHPAASVQQGGGQQTGGHTQLVPQPSSAQFQSAVAGAVAGRDPSQSRAGLAPVHIHSPPNQHPSNQQQVIVQSGVALHQAQGQAAGTGAVVGQQQPGVEIHSLVGPTAVNGQGQLVAVAPGHVQPAAGSVHPAVAVQGSPVSVSQGQPAVAGIPAVVSHGQPSVTGHTVMTSHGHPAVVAHPATAGHPSVASHGHQVVAGYPAVASQGHPAAATSGNPAVAIQGHPGVASQGHPAMAVNPAVASHGHPAVAGQPAVVSYGQPAAPMVGTHQPVQTPGMQAPVPSMVPQSGMPPMGQAGMNPMGMNQMGMGQMGMGGFGMNGMGMQNPSEFDHFPMNIPAGQAGMRAFSK